MHPELVEGRRTQAGCVPRPSFETALARLLRTRAEIVHLLCELPLSSPLSRGWLSLSSETAPYLNRPPKNEVGVGALEEDGSSGMRDA
jgi:hypothetical protein